MFWNGTLKSLADPPLHLQGWVEPEGREAKVLVLTASTLEAPGILTAFELDLVEEILPQVSVEKYEKKAIGRGIKGSEPRVIQSWSRGGNCVHHSDVY